MTGFLHRLAARAMGATDSVRSSIGTGLGAMPDAVDAIARAMPDPVSDSAAGSATRPGTAVPDLDRFAPHQRRTVSGLDIAPLERVAEAGQGAAPQPRRHAEMPAAIVEKSARERHLEARAGVDAMPMAEGRSAAPMTTDPVRTAPAPLLPRVEPAGRRSASATTDENRAAAEPLHHEFEAAGVPGSQELLVPVAAMPPLSSRPPEVPRRRTDQPGDSAPSGADDGIAEVHISIGRIEVTALHEAPAAKSTPRRRQPPMSLDDYLARRQGGRS